MLGVYNIHWNSGNTNWYKWPCKEKNETHTCNLQSFVPKFMDRIDRSWQIILTYIILYIFICCTFTVLWVLWGSRLLPFPAVEWTSSHRLLNIKAQIARWLETDGKWHWSKCHEMHLGSKHWDHNTLTRWFSIQESPWLRVHTITVTLAVFWCVLTSPMATPT